VIADDIWAKLLWAGLNLSHADLPETQSGKFYPFELVHAITLFWLFSGLRSDEIARLRVGCIRWEHDDTPIVGDSDRVLARDVVCLLDVPVHRTGTAFTKPVDPILGQALDFAEIMVDRRGHDLNAWISRTRREGSPALRSFAAGLVRDLDAVTAGLTLPHSSGAVEGHVNRIKMLKRQMYGRANFDLLRKLVIHAG